MPPRRLKNKSVKRLVEKRVAKAIEEYEKSRANLDSVESSGGNPGNAGGTLNVQGCSHKNFMNGKPHLFNGTEGVVGLRRWIEKVEQVFEICKCTEEDKVMFAASTFEGRDLTWWNGNLALTCLELVPTEKKKIERYVRGFPERIKGNITSSKPTTLHDAINMARELVQASCPPYIKPDQGRATRIGESNKRKWEDHQRNTNNNNPNNNNNNHNNNNCNRNNNYHQQQNRRQETARAYTAAPVLVYEAIIPSTGATVFAFDMRYCHGFDVMSSMRYVNLKKCLAEPDVQVPLDEIEIDENLRFVEEPIEIVERDVKKLKRRRIPLVKVRWNSRQGAEYTWEREDQFRKKYPNLFSEPVPSSGVAT
ncbi:hypothetical protein Tco_0989385 [Tanacetum coccineum]|uniref:Reverse transcriptase domain-containing protein n=1 Tax=Tanacetum coccineum TaxID=301880 RepID=A0ABQ5ETG9_9ASTR